MLTQRAQAKTTGMEWPHKSNCLDGIFKFVHLMVVTDYSSLVGKKSSDCPWPAVTYNGMQLLRPSPEINWGEVQAEDEIF